MTIRKSIRFALALAPMAFVLCSLAPAAHADGFWHRRHWHRTHHHRYHH